MLENKLSRYLIHMSRSWCPLGLIWNSGAWEAHTFYGPSAGCLGFSWHDGSLRIYSVGASAGHLGFLITWWLAWKSQYPQMMEWMLHSLLKLFEDFSWLPQSSHGYLGIEVMLAN